MDFEPDLDLLNKGVKLPSIALWQFSKYYSKVIQTLEFEPSLADLRLIR